MIFILSDTLKPSQEWIESVTKTIDSCQYCKDGVDKRPVMTVLHGIINSEKRHQIDPKRLDEQQEF
jgi:hypothetical protein